MPRSRTNAIAGSPAAALETVIATLAPVSLGAGQVIDLEASGTITVGTTGNALTMRIRRGIDITGTVVQAYGALTVVAANVVLFTINGSDTFPADVAGQSYVVTAQVGAATAVSTVGAVVFSAVY